MRDGGAGGRGQEYLLISGPGSELLLLPLQRLFNPIRVIIQTVAGQKIDQDRAKLQTQPSASFMTDQCLHRSTWKERGKRARREEERKLK